MRFRFPIVIIDEDFRSENASGLGIRALAKAIEAEGVEILGVTTFSDVSSFAQQQSHASAFILSVDDEELAEGHANEETIAKLAAFVREIRRRNADIPIFLYGETRTTHYMPNDLLRELHGFIHMFEDTPEFVARYIIREARVYLEALAPPFFRALTHYAQDGSYSWHCPGHSGGVAFLKSPVGRMFHQFFGENMLRADVCNSVDELGQLLDHTGPVAASERNAARIFGADHLFFVTNGTSTSNKIVWHYVVAPERRGRGRSQLPQVGAARDHDDRRDPGVSDADAQSLRDHRPDPARRVQVEIDRQENRTASAAEERKERQRPRQAASADADAKHLRRHHLQRRDDQRTAGRQDRHAALR